MRELVKQKLAFERNEMSFSDAKKYFEDANQPFKLQLIEDIEKFGTTVFDEIEQKDRPPEKQNSRQLRFIKPENSQTFAAAGMLSIHPRSIPNHSSSTKSPALTGAATKKIRRCTHLRFEFCYQKRTR
jgi:hypothetical protein